MEREEKELLLKDLCARLPYGVMMGNKTLKETSYRLSAKDIDDAEFDDEFDDVPYLRPMSSMTEDELKEFVSFTSQSMHRFICESTNTDHWYNVYEEKDWLNAHHFDYRGLIEKSLALEAPEGMYEI